MKTSIKQLRLANWDVLEASVVDRIRILKDLVFNLEFTPASDKIANELILPNMGLLSEFITNIEIEEEEDEEADETKA